MKDNKTYTAPELAVHGNLKALTQATRVGANLDATFPASTPISRLTVL